MALEAWLTVGVVTGVLALMIKTRVPAGVLLFGGVVVVLVGGVVTTEQALSGFSASGLFTVAFMYVLVGGIKDSGGIDLIVRYILGRPQRPMTAQARLLAPVAALSAFLNNTPIVATYIPAVLTWCQRLNLSPSRFLMPLSFAAIMGGTCTLLGTSTNLIVSGLLAEQTPQHAMGLFDIAWIGVPITLVGLVYLITTSWFLLPERESASQRFEHVREYTVEMEVEADGPLGGRTVEAAGLRHLGQLFLAEINRDGNVLPAPGPGERLQANDRLVFAGSTDGVVDLQQIRGLRPASDEAASLTRSHPERRLVEVVVSDQCRFIGQRIRDGNFRLAYGGAVLAICRGGERVQGSLGDTELQPADVLLLEVRPPFIERHRGSKEFLMISEVDGPPRPAHEKAPLAWAIMLGVVGAAASGLLPILQAAMLGAGAMLLTRCCSLSMARDTLDTHVLLTIAAAIGLGKALEASGAAHHLAEGMLTLAGSSPLLTLAAVYLVVTLLTATVTNNAAAVIAFPIVTASVEALDANLTPYIIVLMVAASASFITPIGYQTNLMVYGPGGYHFSDYLRFGGVLNLLVAATTLGLVPLIWPLQ